MKLTNLKQ